jgi:predicted nuclease of predicted toxin-antitoxin system
MRFLVDAQLPRRLVFHFRAVGHDALHTLDLPNGNRTTDAELTAIAMRDGRAVVTKDSDFVNSFLLRHQPTKLLLISTGNIRNADLEALLMTQLPAIAANFATYDYLELTRTALIIHA